jgi:hypothetical protein
MSSIIKRTISIKSNDSTTSIERDNVVIFCDNEDAEVIKSARINTTINKFGQKFVYLRSSDDKEYITHIILHIKDNKIWFKDKPYYNLFYKKWVIDVRKQNLIIK